MAKRKVSNPLESIPAPLRNRYFLVLALFFAWMVFIDRHDLITQYKLSKSVERLEHDRAYFSGKIEEAKQRKKEIESDRERFAREQYYMHKKDEEVFIIQEKE